MKKYLKYGMMGVIAVALSAILFKPQPKQEVVEISPRSYEEIVRSGILRAVTEYNSISFHVDEDTINGLHYELLHAFAKISYVPLLSPSIRLSILISGVISTFNPLSLAKACSNS